MILKNHIANRFLTDDTLMMEIMETQHGDIIKKIENDEDITDEENSNIRTLHETISPERQKAYYITDTITEKLDMLKVEPKGDHYDWNVFRNLKDQKVTFIFSDNTLLRLAIFKGYLAFCWMHMKVDKTKDNYGHLSWTLFHINQKTGALSQNFGDNDMNKIEPHVYKLLCFFYLSENTMIVVEPGKKHGTKRQGKIINTFKDIPVTVVNSNWNVTSIRTVGFAVSGHFRLQRCGPGLKETKMIFIEPFMKNGYVRRAKKDNYV